MLPSNPYRYHTGWVEQELAARPTIPNYVVRAVLNVWALGINPCYVGLDHIVHRPSGSFGIWRVVRDHRDLGHVLWAAYTHLDGTHAVWPTGPEPVGAEALRTQLDILLTAARLN